MVCYRWGVECFTFFSVVCCLHHWSTRTLIPLELRRQSVCDAQEIFWTLWPIKVGNFILIELRPFFLIIYTKMKVISPPPKSMREHFIQTYWNEFYLSNVPLQLATYYSMLSVKFHCDKWTDFRMLCKTWVRSTKPISTDSCYYLLSVFAAVKNKKYHISKHWEGQFKVNGTVCSIIHSAVCTQCCMCI